MKLQPARPGQVQCPMFDPLLFLQRRVGKWWRRGIHREALNFPGDGRWSEVFYPTGAARCFGKLISRPEIFTGWQFIRLASILHHRITLDSSNDSGIYKPSRLDLSFVSLFGFFGRMNNSFFDACLEGTS